jgi:hypothetical protein
LAQAKKSTDSGDGSGGRRVGLRRQKDTAFPATIDESAASLTGRADELERERARLRTFDALQRKARAGYVTGGRVFG